MALNSVTFNFLVNSFFLSKVKKCMGNFLLKCLMLVMKRKTYMNKLYGFLAEKYKELSWLLKSQNSLKIV